MSVEEIIGLKIITKTEQNLLSMLLFLFYLRCIRFTFRGAQITTMYQAFVFSWYQCVYSRYVSCVRRLWFVKKSFGVEMASTLSCIVFLFPPIVDVLPDIIQ